MVPTKIREWPGTGGTLSVAYSDVPIDYTGPCQLVLDNGSAVVFPNFTEASIAAGFAINGLIGGYSEVTVKPASNQQVVTHPTAMDWIF